MRLRRTCYATLAAGAASLLGVLLFQQAPASAAAATVVPLPKALHSGHPLAQSVAPAALVSPAWTSSGEAPGGCAANPSAVSLNAARYAELTTTGAANNCTWSASPQALPTTPGYVYEADVYFSNYLDWPGFWMVGNSWPGQGELDAAEPNFGINFVSWHQAACNAKAEDSEASTNPWAYACKTTIRASGKNIGPGWHVIDIAWVRNGVQIYYDGALYISIRESVTTGQADPMRVVFSEGSCTVGAANECLAGAVGTKGNVQVKYLRVFS